MSQALAKVKKILKEGCKIFFLCIAELLREGARGQHPRAGGRGQLRPVQVAAAVLQILRGGADGRAQAAPGPAHHRRQLDRGLHGGRPGAGHPRARLRGNKVRR